MSDLSLNLNEEDKVQLLAIATLIKEKFHVQGIFCFGKYVKGYKSLSVFESGQMGEANRFNYHLLVISSVIDLYKVPLQNQINELTNSSIRVMLLIHPIDEARRMVKRRNHFFNTVFKWGMAIYLHEGQEMSFVKEAIDSLESNKARRKQANIWFNRALAFKKSAVMVQVKNPSVSEIEVYMSLLAECMEQAFLGLIYLCLGYYPNNTNLSHLRDLSKLFWHEINTFLPVKNEYDKMLFKKLSTIHADLRHKKEVTIIERDDMKLLYMKVCHFVEMVDTLYFPENYLL